MCSSDLFLGFLALLFPPLPVWVKCGLCSADSILNLLLCMLGYVPGLLHAWYIIAKFPEPTEYHGATYDSERGRVAYVIVDQQGDDVGDDVDVEGGGRSQRPQRPGRHQQGVRAPKPKSQPGRQANMSYGTGSNDSGAAGSSSAAPAAAAQPPPPHDYYNGGEGSSEDLPPPPSYAQVMGDNKIQDRS